MCFIVVTWCGGALCLCIIPWPILLYNVLCTLYRLSDREAITLLWYIEGAHMACTPLYPIVCSVQSDGGEGGHAPILVPW